MTHAQRYRMDKAADEAAAFDWDAHNREIEAGLAALERLNATEAALSQARIDMARDVTALLTFPDKREPGTAQ